MSPVKRPLPRTSSPGTIYDYIWLVGDTPGTNNSRFGLEGADPEVACNCTIKV